jgi:hypothetical protein
MIFRKKRGTGALLDTRTTAEKEKDFLFEELVTSADPVNWVEKDTWRKFPIYDQNGSGSCVAQTAAKMLGIHYWLDNDEYVHFSASHIYQRRANKPLAGMIGVNAGQIVQQGTTLEVLAPSQKLTDIQMDNTEVKDYEAKVGEIFKIDNYIQLPTHNIDTVASVIQKTGKPVMTWFYFNHNEWTTEPYVKEPTLSLLDASRHSVTAVDYFLKDDIRYLVIEDSWGTKYGDKGQRFISEDFFEKRNFFDMYFMNFKFNSEETIPDFNYKRVLRKGMRGDDVVSLQDALKARNYFPTNISSTGYFGSITERYVKEFQAAKGLTVDGIVGPKTALAINQN